MSDAEKIAREITTHLQSYVHTDVDAVMRRHVWLDSEAAQSAIATALLAAEARGYAAAREQAAICVKNCKSLDENGYICEKSEAIIAIKAMEP